MILMLLTLQSERKTDYGYIIAGSSNEVSFLDDLGSFFSDKSHMQSR
jgi:Iap family predicted aminopeptidase